MASPIESLVSEIDAYIKNRIATFLDEQLKAYEAQLPSQRSGTGNQIGRQTIGARERGAIDFADHLRGVTRKNERIRRKPRGRRD
jgi:hypothetical protein